MEIKYSEQAVKQIKKTYTGDKKNASMILETIEKYAPNPGGSFDIKILKGKYGKFKRLRAGNYGIIFDSEGNVLYVYEIKHRQESYHD